MSVDVSNLRDRYRRLRAVYQIEKAEGRLKAVESAVRFGGPGEPEPVLQAELELARQRGRTERFPELMLLMVGYSPEPLLSSLAFHRPKEVVLLVSQNLQESYIELLEKLWKRYHKWLEVPEFDQVYHARREVRDSPESLFQEVSQVVRSHQSDRSRVLLEITGAKKSMVGGAFLAAGLLDLEVSYVDFDDYDPVLRRPDPETCRSVTLRNPYTLFRLREQHKLAEAFDDCRYREAQQLADELCRMAERPEVIELFGDSLARQEHSKYTFLAQLASAHSSWIEGFYREALESLRDLGAPVPATLGVLGGVWPSHQAKRSEIVTALEEDRVFADPAVPIAYLLDVLVWNGQTIERDRSRAVFLRLYGALESLIFLAFDALALRSGRLELRFDDQDAIERLAREFPEFKGGATDWQTEVRRAAVSVFRNNSGYALKVLDRPSGWQSLWIQPGTLAPDTVDLSSLLPRVQGSLVAPAIPRALYNQLTKKKGLGRYKNFRNKVVHWVAPVPPELTNGLHQLLTKAVQGLIPPVVEARIGAADPPFEESEIARLRLWEHRLLAAARGEAVPACEPPTYEQAIEWIDGSASTDRKLEPHQTTTTGDAR